MVNVELKGMRDAGCGMQDAGCGMQDAGCGIHDGLGFFEFIL